MTIMETMEQIASYIGQGQTFPMLLCPEQIRKLRYTGRIVIREDDRHDDAKL